ncbi:ABC transporter ABCA1 lipid exporter family [Phytophthora cinnamomi]|uniref:ABC transporter ABCA1 lipid exporter family n=1 Tax=Phytophthora cinnamomi TaxID=4785 RepID=UPI00355A5DD6|nr:ABC transporter ABCA1 lipid exporter family [Phytophthora cinnamomi]
MISPGQTVQSISIRAGERINGIGMDIADPSGLKSTIYHGGRGGSKTNKLTLEEGEYVMAVEAHWGEKGDHTRVKYLSFTTNKGHTVSGGIPTKNTGKEIAPEGYQAGGFFGTCGKEIDSVGIFWTKIDKGGDSDDDSDASLSASGSESGSAASL